MSIVQSVTFVTPEIILLIAAIVILVASFTINSKGVLGVVALVAIVIASLYLPHTHKTASAPFFNLLTNDAFSLFFKEISLFVTSIVILISMGYKELTAKSIGEYYFLLLTGTIAMLLAVSSNNLFMIYLTLEMVSLISYMLVAYLRNSPLSSEGALKYFLFGAMSTGIMLYGISLAYGLFGTTDLSVISEALKAGQANRAVALILLILILAGVGFKCTMVPFHMWAPDVYQGAPTAVTAFISVGPKAVGFAVLLRIFTNSFVPLRADWVSLMTLVSIFTMTIGNVIAISQTDIKRMLAYSSIAQAGYMLIGFVAGDAGTSGVLYYILAYALMNLGAFGCVVLVSNSIKSDAIEDYAGLHKRDPLTSFMLSIFLLSLVGVPPLAGFWGKFMVFTAAIQSKFVLLAIAGVINSVVAAYYYMRVIKFMYLDEPKGKELEPGSKSVQLGLAVLLAGVLIAGIYCTPFMNWVKASQFFLAQQ